MKREKVGEIISTLNLTSIILIIYLVIRGVEPDNDVLNTLGRELLPITIGLLIISIIGSLFFFLITKRSNYSVSYPWVLLIDLIVIVCFELFLFS